MWSTQPGEYELRTQIMLALGIFVQYNSYLKKPTHIIMRHFTQKMREIIF